MRNVLVALNFLGAAQGIFLAMVLFSKKTNIVPNRLLGLLMALFALALGTTVYQTLGLYREYPHFAGITLPLTFLFGPGIFLYARMISRGEQRFHRSDILHLLPSLVATLFLLPFFAGSGADKAGFLHDMLNGSAPTLIVRLFAVAQIISGLVYTALTMRVLREHDRRIRAHYSSLERINLQWLKVMLIGSIAVWGLVTLLHLILLSDILTMGDAELLIGIAISVFVYTAGYRGLRQPEIFHPEIAGQQESVAAGIEDSHPEKTEAADREIVPETQDIPEPRYEKSGMTDRVAEDLVGKLLDVMDSEKPYLNNKLTLPELASLAGTSAHNLSEVINSRLEQNFFEFVNSYRVKEVQRRMADPDNAHLTVLAIALDSGFNSKSTFNSIFKKQTGVTPSQFRSGLDGSE